MKYWMINVKYRGLDTTVENLPEDEIKIGWDSKVCPKFYEEISPGDVLIGVYGSHKNSTCHCVGIADKLDKNKKSWIFRRNEIVKIDDLRNSIQEAIRNLAKRKTAKSVKSVFLGNSDGGTSDNPWGGNRSIFELTNKEIIKIVNNGLGINNNPGTPIEHSEQSGHEENTANNNGAGIVPHYNRGGCLVDGRVVGRIDGEIVDPDTVISLTGKGHSLAETRHYNEMSETEARDFESVHERIKKQLEQYYRKKQIPVISEAEFDGVGYRIDLLIKKQEDIYDIYEVKSAKHAMGCIREALGQILFYNALLTKNGYKGYEVDKLIIAGPSALTAFEEKYFKVIKESIPNLEYIAVPEKGELDLPEDFIVFQND